MVIRFPPSARELRCPAFAEAAQLVHEDHAASWKNKKHADQWFNTLRTYAFPNIGARGVDQIETPDVLKVLAPIWLQRPKRHDG